MTAELVIDAGVGVDTDADAGVDVAVRAWAAAHARSVVRKPIGPSPGQHSPAGGDELAPAAVWRTGDSAIWSLACTVLPSTVSPDGQVLVAIGGDRGVIEVRDALTGAIRRTIDCRHPGPVSSLDWLTMPDGQLILAASVSGHVVRVLDVGGTATVAEPDDPVGVQSVAWAGALDGTPVLVTGATDGTVRTWAGISGDRSRWETASALPVNASYEDMLEFFGVPPDSLAELDANIAKKRRRWHHRSNTGNPAGRQKAAEVLELIQRVSQALQLGATDALGGEVGHDDVGHGVLRGLRALVGHPYEVRSMACTTAPDGQSLVASASRYGVRVCDGRTGIGLRAFGKGSRGDGAGIQPRGASAVSWAALPDGRRLLAIGGDDGQVEVRDGMSGHPVHQIDAAPGWIVSLAWAVVPDGRLLLAAVSDRGGQVQLWDGHTGVPLAARSDQGHVARIATAVLPDGRVLLVAGGHDGEVRIWWISLGAAEPPAPAPAGPIAALAVGEPELRAVEVTPPAWSLEAAGRAVTLIWAASSDGTPLLVTGDANGVVRVWEWHSGELRHYEAIGATIRSLAFTASPDDRMWLTLAAVEDRLLHLLLPGVGNIAYYRLDRDDGVPSTKYEYRSVAAAVQADSRVLVADGSDQGITLRVLGERQLFRVSTHAATSVALAALPDGQVLLAAGVETFDVPDDNRPPGVRFFACGTGVQSVAWAVLPDGSALLASAEGDKVQVWDGATGELLRTRTEPAGDVYSVAWMVLPDGRPLLATAARFDQRTVRVLDGQTLAPLISLPGAQGAHGSLAWTVLPDGQVLLATTPGLVKRHARVWALSPARETPPPEVTVRARMAGGLRPAEAGLLALGRAEVWPPLGLIADLVALTGPGEPTELNDSRLRALAPHPGIARLRALGWPVMARLSFAGLLASALTPRPEYAAPAGGPAGALRDALLVALAGSEPGHAANVGLGELRQGAEAITDRTIALLTVIGSAAAAADPALPVRLAQHAPRMPELNGSQLRLLRDTARPGVVAKRERYGGQRPSPGTAGIGRRGSLRNLLPTQLALPTDLLVARYLQNQLLYRRHIAHIPPVPDPVTLILDTTPPSYGPAENILRLVAHLITTVLWEHGEHPVLISLSQPGAAIELSNRAQLAQLWTTRTLDPPGPAIAAALATAGDVGTKTVLLCHHFAPGPYYLPAPDRRLLTTHHPVEPAPPRPANPNHFHLPTDPAQDQLIRVIWALLAAEGSRS